MVTPVSICDVVRAECLMCTVYIEFHTLLHTLLPPPIKPVTNCFMNCFPFREIRENTCPSKNFPYCLYISLSFIQCVLILKAYYERGVAKLMDGNSKGVLDLNKSLALNSKLFQSFLARAAHYGKTGRFSKAILNCNEAIRLEPASVRAYLCR